MSVAAFVALSTPAFAELKVVVTIKPIHSIVAQVMSGVGKPTLLVDGSRSPHTFTLRPSGARAINKADVFIRVSESVERFTAKLVRALPNSVRLVTLEDTPGLALLDIRKAGTFEAHSNIDDDHAREHGDHAGHEEPHDGHIWLDPENAKQIARQVASVLSERAPDAAAAFHANADRLVAEIDALSGDIERQMKPLAGKPFIVFHDAYQYFEKRFGVTAAGSITVNPEAKPSAKRLTELRRKIASLGAVCVFAEPMFQPRLVAAVTEGTEARSGTLDPEGMSLAAGPQLYFTLMRNLAANLKACLGPTS